MSEVLQADMGVVWAQPDGPNTEVLYLGCHDVADIVQPQGDVATRYCPDVAGPGRWVTATRTKGPPGDVTTTITTYVSVLRDYLQDVNCPVPLYIHQAMCGRMDTFNNYDSGSLLYDADITSKTKSNTAMREGSDATEQIFDVSAPPPLSEYVKLQVTRQVTAETENFLDVAIMGNDQCWGYCGDITMRCEKLVAVEGDTAGVSDIVYTVDGGNTWTAVAGPFDANDTITTVVAFQIDRDTTRILIGDGITGPAGAEVAYSDDNGANWTVRPVGASAGDFFVWNGGLFAGDQYHIWGVTDDGDIWFSGDGGYTWTEQTTAANANALWYVHFADENVGIAVGAAGTILSTTDGGAHWTTETGPAAQGAVIASCCVCLDRNRWLIGYQDGELWYTHNGGTNFYQRGLPAPATAVSVDKVNDINFFNYFHGVLSLVWTGAGAADMGSLLVTHNGGTTWEIYDIVDEYDAAGEPTAVVMCNERLVYNVGWKETTAQIITLAP